MQITKLVQIQRAKKCTLALTGGMGVLGNNLPLCVPWPQQFTALHMQNTPNSPPNLSISKSFHQLKIWNLLFKSGPQVWLLLIWDPWTKKTNYLLPTQPTYSGETVPGTPGQKREAWEAHSYSSSIAILNPDTCHQFPQFSDHRWKELLVMISGSHISQILEFQVKSL